MESPEVERLSDDGYGSDPHTSPRISPTKETQEKISTKNIYRDAREFRLKYFTQKVLNNSANGVIYQGYRVRDSFPVAIKQVPRSKVDKLVKVNNRMIPAEFFLHIKASKCKGVVKVLDWYERKTSFVMVMEKPANSIDLFEFSKSFGAIKEEPARIIIKQIVEHCNDMATLSSILHRDLKDENVLVNTADLSVKIIDFGCATEYIENHTYSAIAGTPEFFPPEMYSDQKYTGDKLNAWSIGILIYILVVGDVPYDSGQAIMKAKRTKYSEIHLTPECIELLDGCLTQKPADRFSMVDITNSKWLNQR